MEEEKLGDERSLFLSLHTYGLKVHYWFTRNDEKKLIFVFQHGLLSGANSFLRVFEPLSQHGSVLAFDRPGFGLTSKPLRTDSNWSKFVVKRSEYPSNPLNTSTYLTTVNSQIRDQISDDYEWVNPYSSEFGAELCYELLKHLFGENREDWGTVVLIGHSLGGVVAAESVLRFPGIFDALILVDAALFTTIPGGILASKAFSAVGKLVIRHIIPKTTPGNLAFISIDQALSPEQILLYQRIFKCKNWDESLFEFGKHQVSVQIDATSILQKIPLPVHVVTGDQDRIVTETDSRRIFDELCKRKNSLCKFTKILQCGHCPHEEASEKFVEEILQFLKEFVFFSSTSV